MNSKKYYLIIITIMILHQVPSIKANPTINFRLEASIDDGVFDPYSSSKLEPVRIDSIGDIFWVKVSFEEAIDFQFGEVLLKFDPTKISYVSGSAVPVPDFGGAVFLTTESQLSEGLLGISNNRLSNGFTGDSGYVKCQFEILDYGASIIEIWNISARNSANEDLEINITNNLEVELQMPTGTNPPTACFAPESGFYYIADVITLDESCSENGTDTLPYFHITPIALYMWSVDEGDDGAWEIIDTNVKPTIDTTREQDIRVRLKVIAPDIYPPTSSYYVSRDRTERLYKIRPKPLGPNIDAYTNKGGKFDGFGCSFAPQEIITICGNVSYNGAPQEGKDVRFELIDPSEEVWDTRSSRTDENGIACIQLRLPWIADGDPDSLLGEWRIKATVDVAGLQASDNVSILFGYLLDLTEISPGDFDLRVIPDPVNLGSSIDIQLSVNSIACEDIPATITFSLYDDVYQIIGTGSFSKNFKGSDNGGIYPNNVTLSQNNIPTWAFVGSAMDGVPRVYVNIFHSTTGIPLSPERSIGFDIVYTP